MTADTPRVAARGPRTRPIAGITALVVAAWVLGFGLAQDDDPFAFMPADGPFLLQRVLGECGECDAVAELAGTDRDAEGWRTYFADRGALEGLEQAQVDTLVHYLAGNLPAEGVDSVEDLPRGGAEIAEVQCTVCHSIALPMTEDRTVERWREHERIPPHDALGLSDREWQTLARYLALNAPVAEGAIPPELLRGAGGY